jgi:hypothetical protein
VKLTADSGDVQRAVAHEARQLKSAHERSELASLCLG